MTDLRNAVENGSYRVEPEKVADKIVKDAVREIRNRLR
jgi:anti-sigma28 factor (negative regulator of flagellin synthesis)